MDNRKCCSCNFGYNHLICTACRYMYCNICINLNHHDSTIDYYLKELDRCKVMILLFVVTVYILIKD